MAFLDDLALGRYEPADSLLHRLDPRVKFALLPALVVASFAAASPGRLGGLAALVLLLLCLSRLRPLLWCRGVWALRWLLLFTLAMHLAFSPGRALWGTAWLSLGGLFSGTRVCCQLVLAVLFSSLLTLPTPPQQLAAAFGWFLAPLGRLRFPVEETTALLLLVLHFIPVLQEEGTRVAAEFYEKETGRWFARARLLMRMVAPMVSSLADRADSLALALARGDEDVTALTRPEPFPPLGVVGGATLLGGGVSLVLLFGWLR